MVEHQNSSKGRRKASFGWVYCVIHLKKVTRLARENILEENTSTHYCWYGACFLLLAYLGGWRFSLNLRYDSLLKTQTTFTVHGLWRWRWRCWYGVCCLLLMDLGGWLCCYGECCLLLAYLGGWRCWYKVCCLLIVSGRMAVLVWSMLLASGRWGDNSDGYEGVDI